VGAVERKRLLQAIGEARNSAALLYVTSDRPGMESQIGNDAFDYFVQHLNIIWKSTKRITLILHTAGGDTSAAWRLINLLRIFCEDLEVLIPTRAHSAGTLISLGAKRIVMTKQASLGPIDPSLTGPLSPGVPGQPHQRVPVSVEAVQGYIDLAREVLGISDDSALAQVLNNLSAQVHPLVLGQIFRSRNQIRSMAEELLADKSLEEGKLRGIVNFLCSESGSHDRTINRREATSLGLNIEQVSAELYPSVNALYEDFCEEMELRKKFDPMMMLGSNAQTDFSCVRVLIESLDGGSTQKLTKGTIRTIMQQQPGLVAQPMPVHAAEIMLSYEGWEHSNG
jgi:hypothetical protein